MVQLAARMEDVHRGFTPKVLYFDLPALREASRVRSRPGFDSESELRSFCLQPNMTPIVGSMRPQVDGVDVWA
jgi:hypothetical protein